MFDHPTIDAVSTLSPERHGASPPEATPTRAPPRPSQHAEEVAAMGDAEIEALLDARLRGHR